jgi:dTDP-4-dehydrorhamnose reductase
VRALVTGATGQLGVELLKIAPAHIEAIGLAHSECDISEAEQVDAALETHRPQLVINAAAFTAVDAAESAAELARAVNAAGAGNVARGAQHVGARVIHVSTDYVFDGTSATPYTPASPTDPINVYGISKLAGEKAVQEAASGALIIRSSWLYASHGRNFLNTILSALRKSKPLRVVDDQRSAPTSARSLAETIWECAGHRELRGIQHWSDAGTASWYDFAVAIQEIAVERGILERATQIAAVATEEYPTAARRPRYSVLDISALSSAINRPARPWRTRLAETISELK